MKRTCLLLIAGAMVAAAGLCVAAVAPVPAPGSSEIEQLRSEIAALRQRVETLEQRLKEGSAAKESQRRPDVINPYSGLRPVPPYWKQFEFNGMPCYIIPIDKAHPPANEVTKPVSPDKGVAAPEATPNSSKP
jgi:hypothetical protein